LNAILIIAGPDANPMIVPLRKFGMEHQRMLPRLPQESPIQSVPLKRLVMSWQDREINVWHIKDSSNARLDSSESETEADTGRTRKLVAKIFIKGEANITSASISAGGDLLAVSTLAEIKVFGLKSFISEEGFSLRVSKLKVPRSIFTNGAKLIQFSPDGNWLSVVKKDNSLIAARVVSTGSQLKTSFKIHPLYSKLVRIDRKLEKNILLGGLGCYDRTITRMAFSSDSRIFAVGDLGGYIDTWVLEGQQDLSQSAEASEEDFDDDASSAASSDGYASDEEEKNPMVILGQHWIRNPNASLLPKLSSAPVVLSFRPATAASRKAQPGVVAIAHPTRRNPHPVSYDLPSGEDRLLVVTATSKVHEFEVLKGGLTEWSRTNPTAKFPLEFRILRDQAMGCLWDTEQEKQRLWLYGSNWIWMFDLSRNISAQKEQELTDSHSEGILTVPGQTNSTKSSRKRKRGRGTGAGGLVPDSELGTGMSRKIHNITLDGENESYRETNLDARQDCSDVDLDDSDSDDAGENFGSGEDVAITLHNGNESAMEGRDNDEGPPLWWHSHKYRPIMGIVPLLGEADAGLEVALVERPVWESDLPPRYYGNQEWEKHGV
jgi:U3 small nucleolar RNA-associated protein 4